MLRDGGMLLVFMYVSRDVGGISLVSWLDWENSSMLLPSVYVLAEFIRRSVVNWQDLG